MAERVTLALCCVAHLFRRPRGWRGTMTYCACGTLLVLRDGDWRSAW